MPSRDTDSQVRALLQAIQREHGTTEGYDAMAIQSILALHNAEPKWVTGHKLLRDDPSQWFRGTQIDERDLALINASPLPWVDVGKQSYLKHVVCANLQLNPSNKCVTRKLTVVPAPQAQGPALPDGTQASHPHPNTTPPCCSLRFH